MVVFRGDTQVFQALGPVPGHLPQTAPCAEWCAAEVAATVWTQGLPAPRGDCLQVVSACCGEPRQQLLRGFAHGGHLRRIIGAFGGEMLMSKVKAHRDIDSAEGPFDRIAILGNDAADLAAKAGARLHPQGSTAEVRDRSLRWIFLQQVVRAAAELTALWPPLRHFIDGRAPRAEGARAGGVGRSGGGIRPTAPIDPGSRHAFASFGGRILCERCLVPARSWAGARKRTATERCEGRSEVLWSALTSTDLGHSLGMGIYQGRAFLYASRVGSSPVRGSSTWGGRAWARLAGTKSMPCPWASIRTQSRMECSVRPSSGWERESKFCLGYRARRSEGGKLPCLFLP